MTVFILKLTLTPALISLVSLVGRRWGSTVSGWMIGMPLTSGPIVLFLILSNGTAFGVTTAIGTLEGAIAEVVFCLTYGWLALRFGWQLTIAASWIAYFIAAELLQSVTLPLVPIFVIVVLVLLGGVRLMTGPSIGTSTPVRSLPNWDIPLRMIVATSFVVALTSAASLLGPRMTGLLAPFPLFATVLALFAHRLEGPVAAFNVLKGMLLGLFAFASFFFVLALLLEPTGIVLAFAAAILTALVVQGFSLWILQQNAKTPANVAKLI